MIYLAFYKPYGVLSQFSPKNNYRTLKEFNFPPGVYPCGRLDYDSEGLLILSNDGKFNQRVTNPIFKKEKKYLLQVERIITEEALKKLEKGVLLNDGWTLPAKARIIDEPDLPPRIPPIRFRKTVPTSWVELIITEGRNRQCRRMLASVGFPVLRLVRWAVGIVSLDGLEQGKYRELTKEEIEFFMKD